jgi:hypothetical protein
VVGDDRLSALVAPAVGDLGDVLKGGEQLHTLAGAGRGDLIEVGQRGDVGRLVQAQQQRRVDRPADNRGAVKGGRDDVGLLERAFRDEPPDLVLLETLSLVNPESSAVIERLVATGLPVWVSFRRCRDGLCGVYGQHWGGPEGDRFGRVAHRLEEMGVAALLVNCIPPDHVSGMVSWLRGFTDLPLGVYPDLGYLTEDGCQFATDVGDDEYAASEVLDLYPRVPHERWEVIVASLFQMPVDPFEQTTSHRPVDYWGRNLVDHLLAKLPDALAPGGVAYVMQLSILGRERTDELLAEHGLRGRVADFAFFPFTPIFDGPAARPRSRRLRRAHGVLRGGLLHQRRPRRPAGHRAAGVADVGVAEDPPDLVILETLDAFPSEAALGHLGMVVELGLPVWLSFRMNAGGFCDAEAPPMPCAPCGPRPTTHDPRAAGLLPERRSRGRRDDGPGGLRVACRARATGRRAHPGRVLRRRP